MSNCLIVFILRREQNEPRGARLQDDVYPKSHAAFSYREKFTGAMKLSWSPGLVP